jgi:hypothetical protein
MIFLRGIGCNWLVCLACFFSLQGRDLASKVIGIWWPTFAFVSLGFDHVVANMTFIPMAIWVGAPDISVGLYIWKGIIPTLLGNIVGGGVFCGKSYILLFLLEYVKSPQTARVSGPASKAVLGTLLMWVSRTSLYGFWSLRVLELCWSCLDLD